MNLHDLNMTIAHELKAINDDAGAFVAGILSDDIGRDDQDHFRAAAGAVGRAHQGTGGQHGRDGR
jgi:thiamine biosynthesis protein ThiC